MSDKLVFYFDQTRCIACNACAVACKDWNDVNPGPVAYRKVSTTYGTEAFPDVTVYNISQACHHCEDPKCVPACASGAIYKRADGIVVINKNKCKDYRMCITACPYGAIAIADDKQEVANKDEKWQTAHPAQKCHMCYERLDAGLQAACVAACPQRALDIAPLQVLIDRYGELVQIENKEGTNPNFYMKKRV